RAYCYLHSFPTRRSSDLVQLPAVVSSLDTVTITSLQLSMAVGRFAPNIPSILSPQFALNVRSSSSHSGAEVSVTVMVTKRVVVRSEEHTSDLQSRENLVC